MTEVPFVCVSAMAFLLIWRGVEDESAVLLALGCCAAIVSCFIRQTGVINIAAPLMVVLLRRKIRFAAILATAGAVIAAVFLIRPEWLSGSPAEFASHAKMWHESSFRLPEMFALAYHYVIFNIQNAALFFLPLVAPLLFLRRKAGEVATAILSLCPWHHPLNLPLAPP